MHGITYKGLLLLLSPSEGGAAGGGRREPSSWSEEPSWARVVDIGSILPPPPLARRAAVSSWSKEVWRAKAGAERHLPPPLHHRASWAGAANVDHLLRPSLARRSPSWSEEETTAGVADVVARLLPPPPLAAARRVPSSRAGAADVADCLLLPRLPLARRVMMAAPTATAMAPPATRMKALMPLMLTLHAMIKNKMSLIPGSYSTFLYIPPLSLLMYL